MTVKYSDFRLYDASRERIFRACCDAMQPCGFTITSTDPEGFMVRADAPYKAEAAPDAGLFDELATFIGRQVIGNRFGEDITLSVDDSGRVHASSISRPRTTMIDGGKNKENVISLWRKLDEYLLRIPEKVINIGNNSGVVQSDSSGDVRQTNVVGTQGRPTDQSAPGGPDGGGRWDVGVVTILSEEMHAVRLALGLRTRQAGGLHFYEGEMATSGDGPLRVVATRALDQGQRSAMAAYENLRRHYDPRLFALVGIGGRVHPDVAISDVVVATRIVYYDLRKETPQGTRRRGEERTAPAEVGHAVNAFFTDHQPPEFPVEDPSGRSNNMRVRQGLIGSGEAVIADHDADEIRYLSSWNDKVLAVDMEAAGLSAACHERSAATGGPAGWVVVRGISDDAGPGKNDDHHRIASWHAAVTLGKMLPYLGGVPTRSG